MWQHWNGSGRHDPPVRKKDTPAVPSSCHSCSAQLLPLLLAACRCALGVLVAVLISPSCTHLKVCECLVCLPVLPPMVQIHPALTDEHVLAVCNAEDADVNVELRPQLGGLQSTQDQP